jgi:tetratricopeptide (TPR) repeat protein
MKRSISLWLGLLAFALVPVLAQTPPPMGKIHGHITNDAGITQTTGTVSLSTDGGPNTKFSFTVDASGNFSGEAAQGTYTLVYRTPGMAPDKLVDKIEKVKIVAGQDMQQDIDMTRKEFIDQLTTEEKKALEEYKKKYAEASKANTVINALKADLNTVSQDFKDISGAHATAVQTLGATAAKADIDAKEIEIKIAKYTEIETLMLKDTPVKPEETVLWAQLGLAQLGLANVKNDQSKYVDAQITFKKVLEIELASKKPNLQTQAAAYSGIGEINARSGKVAEANAAYDSAAKVYPAGAWNNLKNEAVVFMQVGNGDASAAAADEAIKVDPNQPLPYYLKGQGLIPKATIDPASGKMILPPGCAEAYQKYLDLAPTGPYANDIKGILSEATQTHSTSVGTQKPKKGK